MTGIFIEIMTAARRKKLIASKVFIILYRHLKITAAIVKITVSTVKTLIPDTLFSCCDSNSYLPLTLNYASVPDISIIQRICLQRGFRSLDGDPSILKHD